MGAKLLVLSVELSFAVGIAVAERLHELAAVEHCTGSCFSDAEFDPAKYDLVVLCPYVRGLLRRQVLARFVGTGGAPAVVDIRETPDGHEFELLNPTSATPEFVTAAIAALAAAEPASAPSGA